MRLDELKKGQTYQLKGSNVKVKAIYLDDGREWLLVDEWSHPKSEWKIDPRSKKLLKLDKADEWRPDGMLTLDDLTTVSE